MKKIVLASSSPRRKQILEWAEIEFDILTKETNESFPPGLPVEEVPIHIAREKARAVRESEVFRRYEDAVPVLAADTIVVLNNQIIGKPGNRKEAIEILSGLSGNCHLVITGIVVTDGTREVAFSDTTQVEFHQLQQEEIIYYVEKYNPFDKAGAYAIQEWIGVIGIKRITGDFYNVMGLPVSRVVRALKENF